MRKELLSAEIQARYSDGKLLLYATGEMPDTCVDKKLIRFEADDIDADPPVFSLVRQLPATGEVCGDKLTQWSDYDIFNLLNAPKKVLVRTTDGEKIVDVQQFVIGPAATANIRSTTQGSGGEVPFPFFTIGDGLGTIIDRYPAKRVMVKGYSTAFSLQEAIDDALSQLPPDMSPDLLHCYDVENISVAVGGIAGIKQLCVTLSGY